MIDEARSMDILEAALAASSADDLELSLRGRSSATTRVANQVITQNVETRTTGLSVTAYFGRRKGASSTSSVDPESVRAAVRRAEEIARLSPEDPETLPSLGPQTYRTFPTWVAGTAEFSPEARAEAARAMVEVAQARKVSLAGVVERHSSSHALATRNGLRAYQAYSSAAASCTADAGDDGTGWASDSHRDVGRVNFAALSRHASDRALASTHPQDVEAGDWTVLLEPPAVTGLLSYMLWLWGARDTYAGRTFLSNRVGEQLMGENISLRSAPFDPDLHGAPFDWDGIPAFEGKWVDAGRVVRFYHDRWTATEHGIEPTGWPMGLVLDGGAYSREELISTTERGLLVSRFWYIRSVDPMKLLLTGMTRDGTFLVEDGKIVHAVRNLRFNESTLGAFSRVDAMSPSVPAGQRESQRMRAPMMRVADFHFDSVTRF